MPRIPWLVGALLAVACGDATTDLEVTVLAPSQGHRPEHLRFGFAGVSGVMVQHRVPRQGALQIRGEVLATIRVQVDPSTAGERKLWVLGMRGTEIVSQAAQRWTPRMTTRLSLVLSPELADQDGDGIPDQVDDCPEVAGAVCTRDAGAPTTDGGATGIEDASGQTSTDAAAGGIGDSPSASADTLPPDAAGPTPADARLADAPGPHVVDATAPAETTPSGTLADGLVAAWRLDEAGSAGVALDSSGSGNDANLSNLMPATARIAGRVGRAVDVGGVGWLEARDSASLDTLGPALTIALWTSPGQTRAGLQGLVTRTLPSGLHELFALVLEDGRPLLLLRPPASDGPAVRACEDTSSIAAGRWTHLAASFDGTTARLYVDGRLRCTQAANARLGPHETSVFLGSYMRGGSPASLFHGSLDEVFLWRRALNGAEVERLALGQRP